MLSFLRRSTRSSPPRSPLRDIQWDGSALTVSLDAAMVGERVALDFDGVFFADTEVAADGDARFFFPFSPTRVVLAAVLVRRGRDGELLCEAPRGIRFGQPGLVAIDTRRAEIAALSSLGDIGGLVPFGIDCTEPEVAIVMPVYDAPAEVERCIESVLEHTTGCARLIVIDDASPDPAIAPLLERYASRSHVRVLRNERNLGFTATANRGIREGDRSDVVLLNADTEVGPNWLTGLRRATASAANVATVTAVSNNAGAFSVPELERENAIPAPWTFVQTARALWQHVGHAYPELPTGNGFCMYIRRAVIDAVGAFDEIAFSQGYGEENDFCQRASALGLRHLVAGNIYVRHARSASFGHERRVALGRDGMAVLRQRWPNYEADVDTSLHSFERRVLDWRVRRIFATAGAHAPRMRVLCAGENIEVGGHDVWRLRTHDDVVDLSHNGHVSVSHAQHCGGKDADSASLDEHLWNWLQAYAIEAVIVSSDFPHSPQPLASALGIPFVRVAHGDDANAMLGAALATSRTFAERES